MKEKRMKTLSICSF